MDGTVVPQTEPVKNDGGRGGRLVAAHVEADRQQHDSRESYRGPRGEPRDEAGRHGQDDAEAPGWAQECQGRKFARDASRAFRLRLDEAGRASQAHVDEGAFCGRTSARSE
jgi:hypothetical protein